MNFSQLKEKLNIRLNDNDDFAFTSEEKDSILTEAIEDPHVVKQVWDDSLTFTENTWQYAVPSGVTTVTGIYVKDSPTSDPEPIALPWEIVEGNIHFTGKSSTIPNGYTLYIRGNYKYTISDTIAETRLQQYILNLAQVNAMDEIGIKKILKFVKNDTSISEMLAVKSGLERKVAQHRASLPRTFQAA